MINTKKVEIKKSFDVIEDRRYYLEEIVEFVKSSKKKNPKFFAIIASEKYFNDRDFIYDVFWNQYLIKNKEFYDNIEILGHSSDFVNKGIIEQYDRTFNVIEIEFNKEELSKQMGE